MPRASAFAAYAAGVAALDPDGDAAVARLITLAGGQTDGLRDARDLLRSARLEPDTRVRAVLLVERAITRTEQSRRAVEQSQDLARQAAANRAAAAELRRQAARRRQAGDGRTHPSPGGSSSAGADGRR